MTSPRAEGAGAGTRPWSARLQAQDALDCTCLLTAPSFPLSRAHSSDFFFPILISRAIYIEGNKLSDSSSTSP